MGDDVGVSARPLGRTDFGIIVEGCVISLNRTHQKFKNPLCVYIAIAILSLVRIRK